MSRIKTRSPDRRRSSDGDDVTLAEALERIDNPGLASSLSVFYAELARAQAEGDRDGVAYARSAIAEAMRGVPEGDIDVPLLPRLRKRVKRRKR
jgi:hypothetical protein